MLISDVLHGKSRGVIKARTTDTAAQAVRVLAENQIGAVMVEDRWLRPVGVFSERDFIHAVAAHGVAALDQPLEDLMSTPILSCRSSDRIDTVLGMMTLARTRHMPVIDDKTVMGMVSIGDLVKHRLDEKELETSVLLDIARMRV